MIWPEGSVGDYIYADIAMGVMDGFDQIMEPRVIYRITIGTTECDALETLACHHRAIYVHITDGIPWTPSART